MRFSDSCNEKLNCSELCDPIQRYAVYIDCHRWINILLNHVKNAKNSSSAQRTKLGQKLFVLLIRCDGIAVISLNEFWMQALWLYDAQSHCIVRKISILNCIFHFRSRLLCVRYFQKQKIFDSALKWVLFGWNRSHGQRNHQTNAINLYPMSTLSFSIPLN